MSSIENQVVSMTFDGAGFEKGVSGVLKSLEDLRASLDFTASQNTFAGLEAEAAGFDLSHIEHAVDSISSKFSALGAIAFTVLQDMTQSAINAGKQIFESTLGQLQSGGRQRYLAIEQAKFQFEGLEQDVEASMASALEAVRGTAFGLDEAATVAANFGASGITAGAQMTEALRGVAGVAALTGRSYAEMGMIFQDVAGQGNLSGMHLFSFATRGLNMAKALAKEWGVTENQVREMATAGEISFQEFADAVSSAFGEQATKANETYAGSLANLRAAMNRLGVVFVGPRLEAFRNIFNALAPAIDNVTAAFEPLVRIWTRFVNAQAIRTIDFVENLNFNKLERVIPHIARALTNLYDVVKSVLRPIKEAFRDIFPPIAGRTLENMAISVKRFTASLELSEGTADKVRSVFRGLFSVASIGFEIFKGIIGVFGDLISGLSGAGAGALSFGASFGDTLAKLQDFLVDGGKIADWFDNIGGRLRSFLSGIDISPVVDALSNAFRSLGEVLNLIFGGTIEEGEEVLGRLENRFGSIGDAVDRTSGTWDWIIDKLNALKEAAQNALEYFQDAFDGFGESLGSSLNEGEFNEVLDVINVGLLGAIGLMFRQFFKNGLQLDFGGGVMENISTAFEELGSTLQAFQIEVKARALMRIAQALGLLTISIFALSLIDSVNLTKALTAIGVGFGQLVAGMVLMEKLVINPAAGARLIGLGIAMTLMAGAMILLSFAVRSLAKLGWEDLAKGLLGVTAMLLVLTASTSALSTNAPGMIVAGLGLIAVGVALNIVALAVKQMAGLSWGEMVKGLVGVGAAIYMLSGALNLMPPNMFATGAGLLLAGVALNAIALSVKLMAGNDWEDMARGLVGIAGALLVLSVAANAMSTSIPGAVAIGIMSVSLIALAQAMKEFADMDFGDLGMGLLAMAGGLTVLGLAAHFLAPVLPSMALLGLALIPLSFGLTLFGGALKTLGNLSWAEIGKGLLVVAAGMIVIGGVSFLLSETIPFVIGFAAGLALLGGAIALFGAGAYLLARAFQIIGQSSADARDRIFEFITGVIELLPQLAAELAEGVIAFLQIIIDAAPELIEGIIKILGDLLEGISELAPQFGEAIMALLDLALSIFEEYTPSIIAAGLNFIINLLQGLRDNLPEIVVVVTEIITTFLNTLSSQMPSIVTAGVNLIVAFFNGLQQNIGRIVTAGTNIIVAFISGIQQNVGRIVTAGTNLIVSVLTGIGNSMGRIATAGVNLIIKFLNGIRSASNQLTQAAFDLIINLIQDLTNNINENVPKMEAAARALGEAIGRGIASGIGGMSGIVKGAISGLVQGALASAGVVKPQDESMAVDIPVNVDGGGNGSDIIAGNVISGINLISEALRLAMSDIDEFNPTISPVLDLSAVEHEARRIGAILATSAEVSNGQAQAIARDTSQTTGDVEVPEPLNEGVKQIIFEQTIHSPRELSAGTIYRQTRSQITLAKEELGVKS